MKVLRAGGTYLLMPHGECYEKKTQGPPCLSAYPKKGVRQLNYVTGPDFEVRRLWSCASLVAWWVGVAAGCVNDGSCVLCVVLVMYDVWCGGTQCIVYCTQYRVLVCAVCGDSEMVCCVD